MYINLLTKCLIQNKIPININYHKWVNYALFLPISTDTWGPILMLRNYKVGNTADV